MKFYGNQIIDDGMAHVTDSRYKSTRSERPASFCMSAKPERVYFYGHKMPVIGEVRGLRRNPIKFRAVFTWNETYTNGTITAVELFGATKKDKQSMFITGDIINIVNSIVGLYKEGE